MATHPTATTAVSRPESRLRDQMAHLRRWYLERDPTLVVAKRGVRAAIVVPVALALGQSTGNSQTTFFAAFGAMAFLVMMGFSGPWRLVLRDVGLTALVGAAMVVLGTLCSGIAALAVVMMGLVGFVVLFGSVVSPSAVRVSTGLLLLFVLPVSLPAGPGEIGPRLLGVAIAVGLAAPALVLVLPSHIGSPLRRKLADCLDALGDVAGSSADDGDVAGRMATVQAKVADLLAHYEHTANLPIGLGEREQALGRLVGCVASAERRLEEDRQAISAGASAGPEERRLHQLAAEALHGCARLLEGSVAGAPADPALARAVAGAPARLDEARWRSLDDTIEQLETLAHADGPAGAPDLGQVVDLGLRRRMLSQLMGPIAELTLLAAGSPELVEGARREGGWARLLRWFERCRSWLATFASPDGVWFRNSVRGALALALAVLVITQVHVAHGFWVILGTLSVLRSNAAGTRSSAVNAVVGTGLGVLIGSLLLVALRGNLVGLWVALPIAVFLCGVASTAISFLAGQAAFSFTILVLFEILQPGHPVGLVRVGDVAIGCGVALGAALLFWPRGATGTFGRALGTAMVRLSEETVAVVDRFLAPADRPVDTAPSVAAGLAASRRLDDAYRQFLLERGRKRVPVCEVTGMFTDVLLARFDLRILVDLPTLGDQVEVPTPSIEAAGRALTERCTELHQIFEVSENPTPDVARSIPDPDPGLKTEVFGALEEAALGGSVPTIRTTLRLLMVADALDRQYELAVRMAAAAEERATPVDGRSEWSGRFG